jgi:hypothetical protein
MIARAVRSELTWSDRRSKMSSRYLDITTIRFSSVRIHKWFSIVIKGEERFDAQ